MLSNSLALVTGGAKGLGFVVAKHLQQKGAATVIFDNDQLALNKLPNYFLKYLVDITDPLQAETTINEVIKKNKKIDILINNAGLIYSKPLISLTNKEEIRHNYESYKKIIDINMHSVFLMTSLVTEKMVLNRNPGIVINISSICASGSLGQSAYSAAKAGVNAFTKTWAKELGPLGIRVCAIAPGFIDTPSTRAALKPSMLSGLTKRIPLRKLGKATDVAQLVLSVIENSYINGAILEVDGGVSL